MNHDGLKTENDPSNPQGEILPVLHACMQEQEALQVRLLDALTESSPMHHPDPRVSGGRRGSGGNTYSHLRPPSLQPSPSLQSPSLQPAALVPRSMSSSHPCPPSRFSDTFGAAMGALPAGSGRVSRSRSGAPLGGAVSAGPTSLRSDHTAAFSLRDSSLRDDGVGSFDDDADEDSRRLDELSDALTHLFMAGLQTGSNGSGGPSQAERLIQDLTELRLLGRGACGYVYKVGRRVVCTVQWGPGDLRPLPLVGSSGVVGKALKSITPGRLHSYFLFQPLCA